MELKLEQNYNAFTMDRSLSTYALEPMTQRTVAGLNRRPLPAVGSITVDITFPCRLAGPPEQLPPLAIGSHSQYNGNSDRFIRTKSPLNIVSSISIPTYIYLNTTYESRSVNPANKNDTPSYPKVFLNVENRVTKLGDHCQHSLSVGSIQEVIAEEVEENQTCFKYNNPDKSDKFYDVEGPTDSYTDATESENTDKKINKVLLRNLQNQCKIEDGQKFEEHLLREANNKKNNTPKEITGEKIPSLHVNNVLIGTPPISSNTNDGKQHKSDKRRKLFGQQYLSTSSMSSRSMDNMDDFNMSPSLVIMEVDEEEDHS